MRKAVKLWETSKYWTDRAAGAIRHAKYKELPAVRARRIKGLEADQRKQAKEQGRGRAVARSGGSQDGLTLGAGPPDRQLRFRSRFTATRPTPTAGPPGDVFGP